MNGVQRFLSRREKHHEKRHSKHARSKVLPHFLTPPATPPSPICSGDGSPSLDSPSRRRSRTNSLISLYHKLPSILQPSGDVGSLFLRKKPPCADLTPFHVHVSTTKSSDRITLQSKSALPELYTIFSNEEIKSDKDSQHKVNTLIQRLQSAGITNLGEPQVEYAVAHFPQDVDKAYDLLLLANDSFEGILKNYDPRTKMLGAINRNMVTCYLDALLFAMFARLDSFEAILFDNFSDEPRKRLSAILRLWVNMLRAGYLIPVDLTKHLQEALGKCGWEEATLIRQQDASEAFTFITGSLELPLLTLKMDIYHTGREEKEDDHKFVNERLLEVAIPEQEGDESVTLEDCLETYFNNRIEVKRYLQRQNTLTSIRLGEKDLDKNQTVHIESIEVSGSESPLVSTPTTLTPVSPTRPIEGRRRADSIFNERYAHQRVSSFEKKPFDEKRLLDEMLNDSQGGRPRSASIRKEVLMPAWQFFSLIPWYTDNVPKTDAQVAAHFSAKRPVLGICLKRYMMQPNGTPKRLGTYVDIPLEIGLPHFISDDRMEEEGPLFGNFKLVLQSVVCHRGVSVDSGHYVALVRANHPRHHQYQGPGSFASYDGDIPDSWMRFDDLAPERVTEVDIKQALKEESPYLLFFQVQPIDEELASRGDPPSYAESQSGIPVTDPSKETLGSITSDTDIGGEWDKVSSVDLRNLDSSTSNEPTARTSMSSNRRSSVTFEELESSTHSLQRGRTAPPTPEESKGSFLSSPGSGHGSRTWIGGPNKSRPGSQNEEGRLSLTLSRLTGRGSKDKLQISDSGNLEDPVVVINEVRTTESSSENRDSFTQNPANLSSTSHKKEKGEGNLGRSKSKRSKEKKFRSKSRDPAEQVDKGKYKAKDRPDRECVVM
ncbi:cysteine proteinase [Lojkania enalia]|uniref:ubiquitinyl hydrolase 1 n=1 Tax=Lojkania enalia TaxID=147567 RepID=A0A9P4N5L6_9PLEO|nr:cysteine proteinase [Didymosphaeria enalia]